MSNRSQKIAVLLGMSHGAAAGQLRKKLLFHSLVKLKENVCFVCGEEIKVVDDLSIEHKKPWENASADLFWDLENIAYSHLRCNKPHRHNDNKDRRLIGPEGTVWCSSCKKFLSVDKFYENKQRWHGYYNRCKDCYAEVRKEYPSR
jgi:hypothetical protein